MKKLIPLFMVISLLVSCSTTGISVFKVYEKGGEDAKADAIADKIKNADIVLFGELHNNSLAHWLELRLAKEMYKEFGNNLILGSEMFESDTQIMIDEYFSGLYPTKNFEDEAKLWKNYSTDYKPILEFAKENKLQYIATNVPRRYAAFVSRNGLAKLADLPESAKKYIAPIPITFDPTLPAYKQMAEMPSHSKEVKYLAEAQAVKDATMAYFILKNFKPGKKFLHYNGAYHSDDFQGIVWYLKQYKPDLKIVTITTIEAANPDSLSNDDKNKADYIIVIPDDMTKTY
jgi:uncharacterized iron-regulated protein